MEQQAKKLCPCRHSYWQSGLMRPRWTHHEKVGGIVTGDAGAFCHTCGTRLNADGTVTPMVEAGAGDRAARWLAKKYGDLLRCVPHPYGWACDNCFVAGICGKKYRETGVATTGDECDGVVLAAAYATAGEPPPGPDAEDFIDHRFSQPIPIIQELADDLRATPTGVPFRAAGEPPPGPGEEELLDVLEGYLAVVGGRIVQIADLPFVVTAADCIAKIARALLAGQTTAPEAGSGATRNEEE